MRTEVCYNWQLCDVPVWRHACILIHGDRLLWRETCPGVKVTVFHCFVTIMEKMYLVIFLENVACREGYVACLWCASGAVAPSAVSSQECASVIW